MAVVELAFARTDTGLLIGDISWDYCVTLKGKIDVSTTGSSLNEIGLGRYLLTNPNIIEDTVFSLHISSDDTKFIDGEFVADGLTGANKIVFTVYKTATTTPIPYARVVIKNGTGTYILTESFTDINGNATVYLDNGSYSVVVMAMGYTFSPTPITVLDEEIDQTIYGAVIDIGTPSASGVCRVYEYCYKPDGSTPLSVVHDDVNIVKLPYNNTGKLFSGKVIHGVYNASTGLLYWDLVYGSTVAFVIAELGVKVSKVIPSTGSARLSDIPRPE